jgi:exodeoxyribonuclease VII large subunit
MPVVCGVGHETDFTIADFCSDVRAATPTAAAELAARPQAQWFDLLQSWQDRLMRAQESQLDRLGQRLDGLASRLGRPSQAVTRAQSGLTLTAARLRQSAALTLQRQQTHLERISQELPRQLGQALAERSRQVETLATRLHLLDPQLVLARGYAWLADEQGQPVTAAAQARPGQHLAATLADGRLEVRVLAAEAESGPT